YQRIFMWPFSSRYCSGTMMRRQAGSSAAIFSSGTGEGFMPSRARVVHDRPVQQFFQILLLGLLRLDLRIGVIHHGIPVVIAIECEADDVALYRGELRAILAEHFAASRIDHGNVHGVDISVGHL